MDPSRTAALVTEALSPVVVVFALPLAVAWHATDHAVLPTIGWGLLVALFYCALPMVFVVRGARRGRWDGHWIRDREHRMLPLLMFLVSGLTGMALMLLFDAPRLVVVLAWAMITTLLACMLITQWWKVSIHATVAGGAVAMVTYLYGPWLLFLVPLVALVALVCWSRVALADHTVAQVVAGAALGPVVGGVIFALFG